MAAVLVPTHNPLRRRAFRDGAILVANEAADLVNVPAATNVARALREWAASLRVPAANDQNAQEQAALIERYAGLIEATANSISRLGASTGGNSAAFLLLFQEFDEYLVTAYTEIQELQSQTSTTKFLSQSEVTRRLEKLHEDIHSRVILFCLEHGLLNSYATIQSQDNLDQLARKMQALEHELSILFLARRSPGRCNAMCTVPGGNFFFLEPQVFARSRYAVCDGPGTRYLLFVISLL
ncbi:hypothetical protein FS749_008682 [Ceratobasidium sp. UAMH 11750]|nr:hypothetical protein FS749_008682 [Ceratobasidium sp. UAMH 11750]